MPRKSIVPPEHPPNRRERLSARTLRRKRADHLQKSRPLFRKTPKSSTRRPKAVSIPLRKRIACRISHGGRSSFMFARSGVVKSTPRPANWSAKSAEISPLSANRNGGDHGVQHLALVSVGRPPPEDLPGRV